MERKVCLNEHGNCCRIFRRESIPSCRTGGKNAWKKSAYNREPDENDKCRAAFGAPSPYADFERKMQDSESSVNPAAYEGLEPQSP